MKKYKQAHHFDMNCICTCQVHAIRSSAVCVAQKELAISNSARPHAYGSVAGHNIHLSACILQLHIVATKGSTLAWVCWS